MDNSLASEKAIKLDPKLVMAWSNKAAFLNELGRNEEALQASGKAIELDPNDAMAWNDKGHAHRS